VTVSDLEGHFCSSEPFYLTYLGKYCAYYLPYMFTREPESAHGLNFQLKDKR